MLVAKETELVLEAAPIQIYLNYDYCRNTTRYLFTTRRCFFESRHFKAFLDQPFALDVFLGSRSYPCSLAGSP